jgi:hypothetical protein
LGRHRPTKVEVQLRVLGRDGLRMGMHLLNGLAEYYLGRGAANGVADLTWRRRFMAKNALLQGELDRFFASYHHLCPACDGCCHHAHILYGPLDLLLYGFPPAPSPAATTFPFAGFLEELGHYMRHYLALPLRRVRGGQPEAGKPKVVRKDQASECLGDQGCQIPLGRRPALCMLFACARFLENMDGAAYRRYLRLGCTYLTHLSVALMAAAEAGRQPGGAASALTGQKTRDKRQAKQGPGPLG